MRRPGELADRLHSCDTPSRLYPAFRLLAANAQVFDALADRIGSVVAGRRARGFVGGGDGPRAGPDAPL